MRQAEAQRRGQTHDKRPANMSNIMDLEKGLLDTLGAVQWRCHRKKGPRNVLQSIQRTKKREGEVE